MMTDGRSKRHGLILRFSEEWEWVGVLENSHDGKVSAEARVSADLSAFTGVLTGMAWRGFLAGACL